MFSLKANELSSPTSASGERWREQPRIKPATSGYQGIVNKEQGCNCSNGRENESPREAGRRWFAAASKRGGLSRLRDCWAAGRVPSKGQENLQ